MWGGKGGRHHGTVNERDRFARQEQGLGDPPAAATAGQVRRGKRGEDRVPPAAAAIAAALLYALLPQDLTVGPRWLIPALELVLLIAVVTTHPRRVDQRSRLSRVASLSLTALIIVSNLVALSLLVAGLIAGTDTDGGQLLVAGLQVWATNVIAFGLLYWELDRGGPVSRVRTPREQLPLADFRFTQDETQDTVVEVAAGSSKKADWIPTFVDYLYLSTTNSSAFSPTDTMPLTSRAKMLMALQATAALLTSLLVVARAVAALG